MKEKLAEPLTLAAIAAESAPQRVPPGRCGFSSPGALSSAFLSQVGVRPSVYRNI
jgi:hypothetical protein